MRHFVKFSLISYFLVSSTSCQNANQAKPSISFTSAQYITALPLPKTPTIPCGQCKEEDAKNTGILPISTGVIYTRKFRSIKNTNFAVWHLYKGVEYIGSATLTYIPDSKIAVSVMEWNVKGDNKIPVAFGKEKLVIQNLGKYGLTEPKSNITFGN
jgi:hypothetical protein